MQDEAWKLLGKFEVIEKAISKVGDILIDHVESDSKAYKKQAEILQRIAERLEKCTRLKGCEGTKTTI